MPRLRIIDDEAIERPFDKRQFARLLRYMKPYRGRVAFVLLIMAATSVASLMLPKLMSMVIDDCLGAGDMTLFPWLIAGMAGLSGFIALCVRVRVRIMDVLGRRAIATLRQDLFDHIQGLAFTFFDNRSAGKIMVRVINDVNSLNDLFTNGIINVLVDCITLVLLLCMMLYTNWRLTLISMAVLPLLILVVFVLKRRMRKRWQLVRIKISNMNGYLHESLSGMRITQAFTREKENADIFTEVGEDIKASWMGAIKLNNVFWPSLDIVSTAGTVLVYFFGVAMLGEGAGALSVGTLLLTLWYLGRFWEPLNNLSNFYNQVLTAMASMERIFEIMDTPQDITSLPGARAMPPIDGRVEFDRVTFSYDAQKVVLRDVSFTVRPGQVIALVGPTGAGKSTIVNLVSRFYDATEGAVRIDGHNIKEVELNSLRRQMSVMLQDSFIFSGTILDNIRYGRLDATEEEVIAAAKAVKAHAFIEQMEKGYMTEVNERGSRLSVGQKQLISFARALLNNPRILILDEATSSIDTQTEMLIQQALVTLLKGRTSFVIAHRLSTIRDADVIMVIDDGRIAEAGSHDELMALKGQYWALCEAQYRYVS